jgi:adenosine deaminase
MTFAEAITNENLSEIKKFPKSDLYNHGVLGGNIDYVNQRYNRNIKPLHHTLKGMDEMHQWVSDNIGDLFDGREGRLKAIEATFTQAAEDGISSLETGDDVWAITMFNNSAVELTDALKSIHTKISPEIDFIPQLGISRHCPVDLIVEWFEPFLALDYFKTIDLSGDEFAQPITIFKPIYKIAKDHGLILKAHVGEWGSADSIREAVEELELDEIQHGISAVESPQLMRWLADHNIRVNICPFRMETAIPASGLGAASVTSGSS